MQLTLQGGVFSLDGTQSIISELSLDLTPGENNVVYKKVCFIIEFLKSNYLLKKDFYYLLTKNL